MVRSDPVVLIPDLPQEAWRLLTKFLKCDFGFCHCVSPYFWNSGSITLLLSTPCHIR